MVLRLAETLEVPLRERNVLLLAAGYAPRYRQTSLDTPEMNEARRAVELMLAQQEPYPAVVVDRLWNTVMMNGGTRRFLTLFPECACLKPPNGIRLVFHPQGLRPFIQNWEVVAADLIQRLHREAAANPSDEAVKILIDELLSYPGVPNRWKILDLEELPAPLLTISYLRERRALRFFSTITTFGTPQDIALQELRIECFFPADEATRVALGAL